VIAELVLACCMVNPKYAIMADTAALVNNVPENIFHALILVESSYDPNAVNSTAPVKSYGLTQLTVATAKHHCNLKKKDIMDPRKNLFCGAKVLSKQLKRYGGDVDKALSAYNAGTYTKKNFAYVMRVKSQVERLYLARDIDLD